MASRIEGTTIWLTRGDSLSAQVSITEPDGSAWEPSAGDVVRFKAVRCYPPRHGEGEALIEKVLDNSDLLLELAPADTEPLRCGEYKYDVQVTYADGRVDTVIDRASLRITEEVD